MHLFFFGAKISKVGQSSENTLHPFRFLLFDPSYTTPSPLARTNPILTLAVLEDTLLRLNLQFPFGLEVQVFCLVRFPYDIRMVNFTSFTFLFVSESTILNVNFGFHFLPFTDERVTALLMCTLASGATFPVGAADGLPVGAPVGLAVGLPAGLAVGEFVGELVCVDVGEVVRAPVGDAVGEPVGAAYCNPHIS